MEDQKTSPISQLEAAKRLRGILDEHKGRMDVTLSVAIDAARNLSQLFHDYAEKELRDIKLEIELMMSANNDLNEEEGELDDIQRQYEMIDEKLAKLLKRAKNKEIKSISDFDFTIVGNAYELVERIYQMREKIDRTARNFIKNTEAITLMLDSYLKEKGLLK